MTALSVLGANWRLKPEDRTRLVTELVPWGLRAGSRSADLMCLYYEKHFHVSPVPTCRTFNMVKAYGKCCLR
jgi:ubiquinone biosynthesis protein COQ4